MTRRYGRISGWGSYVPEKTVTNFDLEQSLDTSNEWIVQRTGILARHIAGPDETTATMATNAAREALAKADMPPEELDLIIVATSTPDHLTPPVSSQVQHMLGAVDVPAFALVTGCTGFVYALATAQQFIAAESYRNVMVIGVELLSRHIDWQDRATCVLFGDAAGAVLLQADDRPCGMLAYELGSDGSGAEHLVVPAGGTAEPISAEAIAARRQFVKMNGQEVFKFATRIIDDSCRRVIGKTGLSMDEVDWIIPHQANLRIIKSASRSMNVPMERFYVNIEKYANTSAASIPLALCEGLNEGTIKADQKLLMVSFGAGLTWATALVQPEPSSALPSSNGTSSTAVNGHQKPLLEQGIFGLTSANQAI